MQELRIQADNAAALSLANESCPNLSHSDFREIPRSPPFGWSSQAPPSTQTPERQRATFPVTEPTPRIPGHLSFLTNSLRSQEAPDGQTTEHERTAPTPVSARVPSAHPWPPILERKQISYPVLGPTPKLPGHLSNETDHKLFKRDREFPISPTYSSSPLPTSPPLYSQQLPNHKGASDIEIKPNADHKGKKEEIISVIQAIVSRPLPNVRLDVIAEMILQSQTSSEIEGIISVLDQSFPLVSVVGRLRRIVDVQGYDNYYNPC